MTKIMNELPLTTMSSPSVLIQLLSISNYDLNSNIYCWCLCRLYVLPLFPLFEYKFTVTTRHDNNIYVPSSQEPHSHNMNYGSYFGMTPLIQPRTSCRTYTEKTIFPFNFISHWMGYDRGDSFPFDFEPNGDPFRSENRKENVTTVISHSMWREMEI